MWDDTRWFVDVLEALLELARPEAFDPYYRDIERGIAAASRMETESPPDG